MDYQRLYDELIQKARSESRVKVKGETYYEAHHIIPKCLGGEGTTQQWKTHPNIILLTAKEHFMAHYYLMNVYPKVGKLTHSFWRMCNQASKNQNRSYFDIEDFANLFEEGRARHSQNNSNRHKGKTVSPEHRAKISAAKIGKKPSKEARDRMSAAGKGKSKSPEHRAKISASGRGKNARPISQHTLEGVWVRDWNGQSEAGDAVGVHVSVISKCLNGHLKSAGGFTWRRKS